MVRKNRVLFIFLIYINGELALAYNSYAGITSYYYYDSYLLYLIAYLIILELATMSPLG